MAELRQLVLLLLFLLLIVLLLLLLLLLPPPQGLDLPDVAKNISYQGPAGLSDMSSLTSSIAPSYYYRGGGSSSTGGGAPLLNLPNIADFNALPTAKESSKVSVVVVVVLVLLVL